MRPLDRRDFLLAAAGFAAMPLAGCVARAVRDADAPDLIVHNAKITTLDPAKPEASAFAARDGRFVAVGDSTAILALATPGTRLVDAGGRRVIPGLTDTHTHTVRGGLNYALELRWDGVPSLALALDMLREQARRTPPGQWVRVVGGWSPEQFRERRMPTLEEINAASPDTPVFVLYLYTSALLNRACLRALGIDRRFPGDRYPGGRIVRDAMGEPTGMLLADPSAFILYSTLHDGPRLPTDEQLVSSRHFMKELNRLGITGALDCGGGFQNWPDDYAVVRELHRRDQLTVRIGVSTFIQRPGRELDDFRNWTAQYTPRAGGRGFGDDRLFLLGAGEMLVLSAYDFEVFNRERVVPPAHAEAELEPVVRLLAERGWPFRFHATYDETVGRHLDVLERVHRDTPIDGLHWIVDHAETLSDRNIERIARLGGGVAIQNRVAFQEDAFLQRYGPAAAADAPPLKRILAQGVPVGAGTDMSRVSSYNPWVCIAWLVNGKGVGGSVLLSERTRLDRAQALRLWCDNAWFSRQVGQRGRIASGQFADAAVLNEDYFRIPEDRIAALESVLTIVDGRVVYASEEYAPLDPPLPALAPEWSPVRRFGGAHRPGVAR